MERSTKLEGKEGGLKVPYWNEKARGGERKQERGRKEGKEGESDGG